MKISLDPSVELQSRRAGNESLYLIRNRRNGKYYELGQDESVIVRLLQSNSEITEVARLAKDAGVDWTAEEHIYFVSLLQREQLLVIESGAYKADANVPSLVNPSWRMSIMTLLGLTISQRLPLFVADSPSAKVNRLFGWLFSPAGFLLWLAMMISLVIITTANREELAAELRRLFDPTLWPVLACIWVVAKIVHEFGHAVAAKRQGVKIGTMGITFFLGAPLAYVDITDAWKLPGRFARAGIAMGGVYVELTIAAIAMWFYVLLPDGLARHLCMQVFMVTGPATILVNANPLLRLDGYYVVSDLAEIPNLRTHGRRQLVASVEWLFLGIPKQAEMLLGWRATFAKLHAITSTLFQAVWMSGLIIAISTWAKGLGIALAISAILVLCVMPLCQWIHRVWMYTPSVGQRMRLLQWTLVVLTVVQLVVSYPSPFGRRVPIVVRYHDEQIARAAVDAFVKSILVQPGQSVHRGELLVLLDAPELVNAKALKQDEVALAELKAVQLRSSGDLALSAAESERAESLRRQLQELREQVDSLEIVATRQGVVMNDRLADLMGQYVHCGDEIVRVCEPAEKELLVTVSQEDAQAYELASDRKTEIPIRLRGGSWIQAKPLALHPRASDKLPHPALASTAGGPLVVEPGPDQSFRTISPRLESILSLDPLTSVAVRAGQIGSMSIADDRPIFQRAWDYLAQ